MVFCCCFFGVVLVRCFWFMVNNGDVGRELRAFELYFSLTCGGCRTVEAVRRISEELGVSVRTVYDWKKRGDWDRRCAERSAEVNGKLAGLLREESDSSVEDFRRPFIRILNGLVDVCVRGNSVQIESVKDLISVIELSVKLQRELDLSHVNVVGVDYSREKHIDEINGVLRKLHEAKGDSVVSGEELIVKG